MGERVSAVTAVVLAGGAPDEVAAVQPGAANKAFVRVGGKALVTRTLEALRASQSIGKIIVVAPSGTHSDAGLALADECRTDGARIRDSLERGLEGLNPDDIVLVSASDLPVLSGAGTAAFVADTLRCNADLMYGALERTVHEARFPQVPHTWARMREGTYCGTGFVALRPRVFPLLAAVIERLGAARKNPLRLAALFGRRTLLKFAFRRLSIAEAEDRASQVLGARVRAIITPYPELGVNVDRASDVALAETLV